jgi:predicted HicB family RNase H-like nuclease
VDALRGLEQVVADVVADMEASGEEVPDPIAEKRYSGKFNVRVPESLHRELVLAAAEQGVSLNRLVSDRLARPA